jgi:hypothetical protein
MEHLRLSVRAFTFALAVVALSITPVAAQEYGPDDTASVQLPDIEDKEEKMDLSVGLVSEFHTMNNMDLRRLDESSDQDILESDDRSTFGYSGISVGLDYELLERTEFKFGAIHSALWGNDQLGRASSFQNFLWLYQLSVEWEIVEQGPIELETEIGRQEFKIGGVDKDFFFHDTIDGVTVELEMGQAGTFRLLPFDFYAANSRPANVEFARYLGGDGTVQSFRGDTNTFRFGGVYENSELIDGFDFRVFGFYADIGASTRNGPGSDSATGADRTFAGSLGNFSDRDFSWMLGTRAGYTLDFEKGSLRAFGEFAQSGGIDRKFVQAGLVDVTNTGAAFGGGLEGALELGRSTLGANLRFFHADGGGYSDQYDGMQYTHGFVSFKGEQVGGLNLDRYAGMHPSSYVSNDGIDDTPQNTARKSGTQFFHARLSYDLAEKFGVAFDAWYLLDTSQSTLDQDRVSEMSGDLPFGYTEADLRAQRRLGLPIGVELDGELRYQVNDFLALYGKGGIFLPSQFYETEISRTAGSALGSENPQNFWTAMLGSALRF